MAVQTGTGDDYKSQENWTAPYPCPADFHFNYHKLLKKARDRGIGIIPDNNKEQPNIAIIGAGSAGLTACRELVNCGFKNIDLYEATDRIGGRHVSIPALASASLTTYEMGAMRFPLFNDISLCKHYLDLFDITHCPFPNPLSEYATTGVFWNGQYYEHDPKLGDKNETPPFIETITLKWNDFVTAFKNSIPKIEKTIVRDPKTKAILSFEYDEDKFWKWWKKVVSIYSSVTFRGFALAKEKIKPNDFFPEKPKDGKFQGLNCNQTQASVLYTVGVGDGGWGAFFDICVLWVFRTMLFGYGDNLQQIIGRINNDGTVKKDGYYYKTVTDSRNPANILNCPRHIGVESIDEGLFYLANGFKEAQAQRVPYEVVNFYSSSPVGNIHLSKSAKENDKIEITLTTDFQNPPKKYDHVIVTTNVWNLPLNITQSIFPQSSPQYPLTIMNALRDAHFILSSKIFFPLKRQYWNENEMGGKDKTLPEVWSTDTTCQGVYAMCGNNYALLKDKKNESKEDAEKGVAYKHDKGTVMLSYTWEGDASKLLQYSNDPHEFGKICLNTLDTLQSNTKKLEDKPKLSSCVDQSRPVAIHWGTEKFYGGCSKLYRPYTEKRNMCEIAWNQFYGSKTGLYFAGEAFSLDGGWTEPAMRMAIDAVIHIIQNTKSAKFRDDLNFDFERDYPKWHFIKQNWYKSEIPLWRQEIELEE